MKVTKRTKKITKWISDYAKKNKIDSLVVGVSGGIDSAVVSTLCARTGLPTYAVSLPIKQNAHLHSLSVRHISWLALEYGNVVPVTLDLTSAFQQFEKILKEADFVSDLGFANTRSRCRMIALYQIAQSTHGIVVGTGNKVEDFGVGFFTKYGDGGVDISPIADCFKTEVWEMGVELGVMDDIIDAPPTDGLWDDGRTDKDQLGMPYEELELAMRLDSSGKKIKNKAQKDLVKRYRTIRSKNLHKMHPIPVCKM